MSITQPFTIAFPCTQGFYLLFEAKTLADNAEEAGKGWVIDTPMISHLFFYINYFGNCLEL